MKHPMPCDMGAERAVLGDIMLQNDLMHVAAELPLEPEDFYAEANAIIFRTMRSLLAAGQPVDSVTLRERLATAGQLASVGGDDYLLSLTSTIPTASNIEAHTKIVKDKSTVRAVLTACIETIASSSAIDDTGEWLEQAAQRITEAAAARAVAAAGSDASEAAHRALQAVQERAKNGRPRGHSTGLRALDTRLGGLAPGRLYVLAAATGMGKSGLAVGIGRNVAAAGLPVALFSLEMSEGELFDRLAADESGVPFEAIQTGRLGDGAQAVVAAYERLSRLPLHVVDRASQSVGEIRASARRYRRRMGGLGLIIIDYAQLLRPRDPKDSRERQVAEISRACKVLAGELQAPVLLLSQLNRELHKRTDKRPVLSDLRESGALEQDADIVAFIHRDEVYDPATTRKGIAEIIVSKNRSGACGRAEVHFAPELLRFSNLDAYHLESHPPRRFDGGRP
jgi:replicative DNA helicase